MDYRIWGHVELVNEVERLASIVAKFDPCTDGNAHRFVDGDCTGEDCYKEEVK